MDLKQIPSLQADNETLVVHGDVIDKIPADRGFLGRALDWILGNTNDCKILACLTKAIQRQESVTREDFDKFYELKNEFEGHVEGYLSRLVDALLGRDHLEDAFKKFDHEGHARLRDVLYGGSHPVDEVGNAKVDQHYEALRNVNQDPRKMLEACQEYEFTLKHYYGRNDAQVAEQLQKLADAGFAVAQWRLSPAGIWADGKQAAKLFFGTENVSLASAQLEQLESAFRGSQGLDRNTLVAFEDGLRSLSYNDTDVVRRYEELAAKGYALAAARLVEIYSYGLLGQNYDPNKLETFAELAQEANLEIDKDRLDYLKDMFTGGLVSQEGFEWFEAGLRDTAGIANNEIVKRYEQMAQKGISGAAWRLYQVHFHGLLGQEKNNDKAMQFMTQSRNAGLKPQQAQLGQRNPIKRDDGSWYIPTGS